MHYQHRPSTESMQPSKLEVHHSAVVLEVSESSFWSMQFFSSSLLLQNDHHIQNSAALVFFLSLVLRTDFCVLILAVADQAALLA